MQSDMDGIDYTADTAVYGTTRFENPAGQLLGIIGKDTAKWNRAKTIKETLGIQLDSFNREKMDNLLSILSLANAPYAVDIISALHGKEVNLALHFETERKTIDLERDRSSISIVSERLEKEKGVDRLVSDKKAQKIKEAWGELNTLRQRSIEQSEELDTNGNPKPIDLLVITTGSLPGNADSAKALLAPLNSHESQRESGSPRGKLHEITVKNTGSLDDLMARYKAIEDEADRENRHLVTVLIVHGSPTGMVFPFTDDKQEMVGIAKLTEEIDPSKSSLFISSCYGGEHVRLSANDPATRNFIRGLSIHVENTVNSLVPSEFEYLKIAKAYEKDDEGKFKGDLNKDGKVTLGELRIWLDRTAQFNDPRSYDIEGNRITRIARGDAERTV